MWGGVWLWEWEGKEGGKGEERERGGGGGRESAWVFLLSGGSRRRVGIAESTTGQQIISTEGRPGPPGGEALLGGFLASNVRGKSIGVRELVADVYESV